MENQIVLTVSAGKPLMDIMELCYTANRPVLLKGRTGLGKSAILAEFAKKKKFGCISRDLSLMEPTDLVGMPILKGGRTRFLPPSFLPRSGKGIFILEEINRAAPYMRGPCLMLLTDRSLNDYRLPPGWLPVAAINPAEDGYQADELDPALLSRFVQITVVPDRSEWICWAQASAVHPQVIAYVESDPTVFDDLYSNPRSWAYVSDLLKAGEQKQTDPVLLLTAVAGLVGSERATAFFRFCKDGVQPLMASNIITGYPANRNVVKKWIKEGRLDLVEATLFNLEKHLQAETHFFAVEEDETSLKNMERFLADLPGDLHQQAEQFFDEHGYTFPSKRRAK